MLVQDFNNLDGEVIDYDYVPGIAPVKNNPFEADNFYPADGIDRYAKFEELPSFSNASGRMRARRDERRAARATRKSDRNVRKNVRVQSKSDARAVRSQANLTRAQAKQTRADAKVGESKAKRKMAESLSNEPAPDSRSQVQQTTTTSTTPQGDRKGLSPNAKVGIAIGVVAVVAIVGYVIYKKSKSGK